jgi:hypothetical protein
VSLSAGTHLASYEIIDLLGAGGMGAGVDPEVSRQA